MSLEGLEGPVAAETTHVDAHICAAGGEGGVVLPVHVQGWSCGTLSFVTQPPAHRTALFPPQHERALPEWKGNCCLASPVCASQMIVVCKVRPWLLPKRIQAKAEELHLHRLLYLIYPSTKDGVPLLVPLECKYGSFVLPQGARQISCWRKVGSVCLTKRPSE